MPGGIGLFVQGSGSTTTINGTITSVGAVVINDAVVTDGSHLIDTSGSNANITITGGTTGIPKGAILTHGNLTAAVAMYEAWFNPQLNTRPGEQKVICALPLFHIYALTTILLRQIRNGNEILLRLRFDPETTLRDIAVKRATAFPGVPTMWIALANHPGIEACDFSSMIHCSMSF